MAFRKWLCVERLIMAINLFCRLGELINRTFKLTIFAFESQILVLPNGYLKKMCIKADLDIGCTEFKFLIRYRPSHCYCSSGTDTYLCRPLISYYTTFILAGKLFVFFPDSSCQLKIAKLYFSLYGKEWSVNISLYNMSSLNKHPHDCDYS